MAKIPNPMPEWVKKVFEEAREQVSQWTKEKQEWDPVKIEETIKGEEMTTYYQLFLKRIEEVFTKDFQKISKKDSIILINKVISHLEGIRKRIGKEVMEEVRSPVDNR